jgi:D-alanyl-D-alanine carboxypeptidase
MPRRARLLAVVILVAVIGAACSSSDDDASPADTTGAPSSTTVRSDDGERPPCPDGTADEGGLCVAGGDQAREAAEIVRSTFEAESLGAVVVGVWKEGEPVVVGALGETLTGVPATADMHHRAGNISAAMLTTVMLQQVEAGELALDDPLSTWFPELPAADQITVEMLANSTSGYEHYTILDSFQQAFYADPFRKWDTDEVIAFGVGDGPLFPPGTSWKFSDTNLLILGQVLEAATGRPVAELIQEGVLDPLGMDDTVPPLDAALPAPVLHSYTSERGVWEEATFWDPSWTEYAGGMGSNQEDLRVFVEAVASGELLSEESHDAQLAPTTVGLGTNTAERYYAMGVPVVNGWVFTNPALQGYRGALGHLESQDLTIVVYNTLTPAADPEKRQATLVFEALSALLAPDQPVQLS